ncbi:hypothetical protein HYDPIDRAFT_108429, partial [Hydnomerulius pinastri MD-312]
MNGIQPAPNPRNIIFIGDTGVGKSSIINLIAGSDRAVTSPDVSACTSEFSYYDVPLGNGMYRLWDTPGLNEPSPGRSLFRRSSKRAEVELKSFLRERHRNKEIDLVVYCVTGSRAHKSMVKTYKTFCAPIRQMAAPVVVAVTHLERMSLSMDTWWVRNGKSLKELCMEFDDHACLTSLRPHPRRERSQREICDVITRTYNRAQSVPQPSQDLFGGGDRGCII